MKRVREFLEEPARGTGAGTPKATFRASALLKNCAAATGLLACLALLAPGALAQEYYVYVAAESEDTVALVRFDGTSADVVQTVSVGSLPHEIEGPHGLTVSPDGAFWFVSVAHGQPFGSVVKYATGGSEPLGAVELDLFPATMEMSPATGLLYVANFNLHGNMEASSISVVDPVAMTEVARTQTGVMPHGSRVSPDGRKHYSVAMMSGGLFEMDAVTFSIARRLQTGAGTKPTWVQPHPEHPFVYLAHNGADEIVEIDLAQWAVARRFAAVGAPYNVAITPDGNLLIATLKAADATGIFDLEAGEEVSRIENSRRIPHGVVVSPDGRYAFVSVEGVGDEPGSVDIIDLHARRLVAVAETGRQAGGIAFWKMEPDD